VRSSTNVKLFFIFRHLLRTQYINSPSIGAIVQNALRTRLEHLNKTKYRKGCDAMCRQGRLFASCGFAPKRYDKRNSPRTTEGAILNRHDTIYNISKYTIKRHYNTQMTVGSQLFWEEFLCPQHPKQTNLAMIIL